MGMKYTVGSLSGLTGLSAHTIRAWERRYQALTPDRTQTNRRQYDDADLERLKLLNKIVCRGHAIGQVAQLPTEQLRAFAAAHCCESEDLESKTCCDLLAVSLDAMIRLDAEAMETCFNRAMVLYGVPGMLGKVVMPLIAEMDIRWQDGKMTASEEHLVGTVLRNLLNKTRVLMAPKPCAPKLLVATPQNQIHELGAIVVGIVALISGWNVHYLGPNMPAEEIADAARKVGAKGVALSIVHPVDDKCLAVELADLRRLLGPHFPVVARGKGVEAYGMALKAIHAHVEQDLWSFGRKLASKAGVPSAS